jgi:two-component system phosphate regulon response regulator OmpR
MDAVLVIEEDTLIRELMREHLEREGYAACAVATVRIALDAAQWTRFGLVLLDFASAAVSSAAQLEALRALGAPVLMMRSAPAGTVIASEGEIEQVVWSPFDLTTLTRAVRRFLPPQAVVTADPPEGPVMKQSGTFPVAGRDLDPACSSTLPAPPDETTRSLACVSLRALGALVLESTGPRRRR